jgi:serine/threonine protein kinase
MDSILALEIAAMTQAAAGETLPAIGNYDVLDKIAEGGMGSIYKARHRDTGALVAIKTMPPKTSGNAVLLKRFEQEFRAASKLDHPNIVRALEYGETSQSPYLVMEYVDGESLGNRIERQGRMAEDEAIRIITQVARALHSAHKRGMVHRDVKPDNVLLTTDGQAKLADLGLVKETETDQNLTQTGKGLGTPHFMAPEQFRNAKNADPRCDVYSLAATLYMTVTGELPFQGNGPLDTWMKKVHNDFAPPKQLVPELSDRMDCAIRRGMHPDAGERPATCREFIEELCGTNTRKPVPTPPRLNPALVMWYLVYKDSQGKPQTVKGPPGAIRRSLRDGSLGDFDNIVASRSESGPFMPLTTIPEFRDVGLDDTFSAPPSESQLMKLPCIVEPARGDHEPSETAPEHAPMPLGSVSQGSGELWQKVGMFLVAAASALAIAWYWLSRH